MLGIELDDASHQRTDRQERDAFVDEVFAAVELPLLHQPVRRSYAARELAATIAAAISESPQPVTPKRAPADPAPEKATTVPFCPKCGQPMVMRVVKKDGLHKGKKFWGCRNYPKCRGMLEYKD